MPVGRGGQRAALVDLAARASPALPPRGERGIVTGDRDAYTYLVESGCIEQLDGFHEEYLSIFSREILKKIKVGDSSWESMVPLGVAEVIKRQSFFDYRAT